MSKGWDPPKEFSRFKKPKLDVNVNSQRAQLPTFGFMDSNEQQNLWDDDDDDDVILIATQAAEMQQMPATSTSTQIHQNTNPTQISFSEFGTNLISTSTQRPLPAVPNQMFEDDDDEAFRCLSPKNFQVNAQPAAADQEEQLLRMKNAERRLCIADQQMKLLSSQMTALKTCNKQLNAELAASKENMQIKSGEASLLRDELKHLKQEVQRLKMAKMLSEENAKKKCQTQIEELQRALEARNAQLQLKSAEFASLKMRHADETKRWEDSFCMTQEAMAVDVDLGTSKTVEKPVKLEETADWGDSSLYVELNNNMLFGTPDIDMVFLDMLREPNNYDYSFEKLTKVHIEYTNLQALLGRYLSSRPVANKSQVEEKIMKSFEIVLLDFWNYVQSLTYNKEDNKYMTLDYTPHAKDTPTLNQARRLALLQPEPLIENERALIFRRYIAALAFACDACDLLAQKLLAVKYENMLLLQVLSFCIEKLSYAELRCVHFVLLEAIAELLHALVCLPKPEAIVEPARSVANTSTEEIELEEIKIDMIDKMKPTTSSTMTTERESVLNKEIMSRTLNIQKLDLNQFNIDFKPVIENVGQAATSPAFVLKGFSFEEKEVRHVELPETRALDTDELLADIFKQLVFNRPCIKVLLSLSCLLYDAAHKRMSFIDQLCTNSCADSLKYEKGVFKFNNKSCALQVYANLLIHAFPLYTTLEQSGAKYLHQMCLNHMEFVLLCFVRKPQFLQNALFAYADYLDNDIEYGPSKEEPQCNCYIVFNISVLKLVHKVVYQWMQTYKRETQEVSRISKYAVKLLHLIFVENYITRFFRNDADKTRNTLYLLCKWWDVNSTTLGFSEVDVSILRKIQKSHIMPKQMNEYINAHNIVEDSEKLHVLTNGVTKDISIFGINISKDKAVEEIWQEFTDPMKFFTHYVKNNTKYEYAQ